MKEIINRWQTTGLLDDIKDSYIKMKLACYLDMFAEYFLNKNAVFTKDTEDAAAVYFKLIKKLIVINFCFDVKDEFYVFESFWLKNKHFIEDLSADFDTEDVLLENYINDKSKTQKL